MALLCQAATFSRHLSWLCPSSFRSISHGDTEEDTEERRLGNVGKHGIEDRLQQVRIEEGRFC